MRVWIRCKHPSLYVVHDAVSSCYDVHFLSGTGTRATILCIDAPRSMDPASPLVLLSNTRAPASASLRCMVVLPKTSRCSLRRSVLGRPFLRKCSRTELPWSNTASLWFYRMFRRDRAICSTDGFLLHATDGRMCRMSPCTCRSVHSGPSGFNWVQSRTNPG